MHKYIIRIIVLKIYLYNIYIYYLYGYHNIYIDNHRSKMDPDSWCRFQHQETVLKDTRGRLGNGEGFSLLDLWDWGGPRDNSQLLAKSHHNRDTPWYTCVLSLRVELSQFTGARISMNFLTHASLLCWFLAIHFWFLVASKSTSLVRSQGVHPSLPWSTDHYHTIK